jgi:hypothetical protein
MLPDLELECLLLEEELIDAKAQLDAARRRVIELEVEIAGRQELFDAVVKIMPWYRVIRNNSDA